MRHISKLTSCEMVGRVFDFDRKMLLKDSVTVLSITCHIRVYIFEGQTSSYSPITPEYTITLRIEFKLKKKYSVEMVVSRNKSLAAK